LSEASNIATVQQAFEVWNQDLERFLALVTEDSEVVSQSTGGPFKGYEGWTEFWQIWAAAFPDNRVMIESLVVGVDQVPAEGRFQGWHIGGPLHTFVGAANARATCAWQVGKLCSA
jgi:hypothetical protein